MKRPAERVATQAEVSKRLLDELHFRMHKDGSWASAWVLWLGVRARLARRGQVVGKVPLAISERGAGACQMIGPTLARLMRRGLVERRRTQGGPGDRYEYRLARRGDTS